MNHTGLKSALKLDQQLSLKRNRSSNLERYDDSPTKTYLRLNTDLNSTKISLKKGGTVKKVRHLDESPEFVVEKDGGALVPFKMATQPDYTVR